MIEVSVWVFILAVPSCVTLGYQLHLSGSQFPQL